jgi:hypothetical protein
MSTPRIDWAAVLGRLERTITELRRANRSDVSEDERARRLGVADAWAGPLFEMPMVTASDLPAKAVRALELVWEEGPDFRSESRLTAIWDAIAEQTVDKARA